VAIPVAISRPTPSARAQAARPSWARRNPVELAQNYLARTQFGFGTVARCLVPARLGWVSWAKPLGRVQRPSTVDKDRAQSGFCALVCPAKHGGAWGDGMAGREILMFDVFPMRGGGVGSNPDLVLG
jgi:hypothetical protein